MTTKHTLGPWASIKHCPLDSCDIWEVVAGKRGVCSEATESDARLIAAAPDLLAALRQLTEAAQAELDGDSAGNLDVFIASARTALAKAEG